MFLLKWAGGSVNLNKGRQIRNQSKNALNPPSFKAKTFLKTNIFPLSYHLLISALNRQIGKMH